MSDHQESKSVRVGFRLVEAGGSQREKFSVFACGAIALAAVVLGLLIYRHMSGHTGAPAEAHSASTQVPALWSIIPFVGILLSIAILPLLPATAHWWESNRNRLMVALCFAALTLAYYLFAFGSERMTSVLEHAIVAEYVPFIVLLFSLFVISGGICLQGDLAAHPATNTAFLGVGAVIASLVGTTGASMLLIRPLLATNSERRHVAHTVIFFIFLVSNVGGCLLPIGDPPLFLGYLKGVPFLWTLQLWKEWAVLCGLLLVVYYIWDIVAYRREAPMDVVRDETQRMPLRLSGQLNLVWLSGIVLFVGLIKPGEQFAGLGFKAFPFMRELMMLGLTGLSLIFTSPAVRAANRFNYHAIFEVAALFVGIFICMQPPIEILRASGALLAPLLSSPMRFFWATGSLSSFLDNAPTYVVFFETAATLTPAGAPSTVLLENGGMIAENLLVAVSLGAVFMGAMTYIGNGPNFMVRSIAEHSGVRMPSFFGYMLYSCGVLIPLLVLVTLLFVR